MAGKLLLLMLVMQILPVSHAQIQGAVCARRNEGLDLTTYADWPKIRAYQLSSPAVADSDKLSDQIRLTDRDRGDCLDRGSVWEVDFGRSVNAYSILIQGTSETRLTSVNLQYLLENDTWTDGVTITPNIPSSNSIFVHNVNSGASPPLTKMKKLRLGSPVTNLPRGQRACVRLDVTECKDDVVAAGGCAVGHTSIGLTRSAVHPRLEDKMVKSYDQDVRTGDLIRLSREADGMCLYGGATEINIKFDQNVPLYKLVFQGTKKSLATKVKVEYRAMDKTDMQLLHEGSLTLTDYSTQAVVLPAVTDVMYLTVTIPDASPDNETKCLRMTAFQCPVGTDVTQCADVEKMVDPDLIKMNGVQGKLGQYWDEEANAKRLMLGDYSGLCLMDGEYVDISFKASVGVTGITIQGALGSGAGTLTRLSLEDVNQGKSIEEIPVSLPNPVASVTHFLTNPSTVRKLRVAPSDWNNKGNGTGQNTKTCFRLNLLGCRICIIPLGMDKNRPLIDDNQLSTNNTNTTNLQEARFGSSVAAGFCMNAGSYFQVDFMTTVTVRGLRFQGTTENNVDKSTVVIEYSTGDLTQWTRATLSVIDNTRLTEGVAVTWSLSRSMKARAIRLSQNSTVCIRVEFLGCRPEPDMYSCAMSDADIGLSYGIQAIPIDKFTNSNGSTVPETVRKDDPTKLTVSTPASRLGYCLLPGDYLEIDLTVDYKISQILVQGGGNQTNFVTKFKAEYYSNGDWKYLGDFHGKTRHTTLNASSDWADVSPVSVSFTASKLRFHPDDGNRISCFRLEVKGCPITSVPVLAMSMSANLPPNQIQTHQIKKVAEDTCRTIGKAEIGVKVETVRDEENERDLSQIELTITAWQNNWLCANKVMSLLRQYPVTRQWLVCPPDRQVFVASKDGLYNAVCIPKQKCASYSTFTTVPKQVEDYAESFRQNLLDGDQMLRMPSVDGCKAAAVRQHYPSYFYDTTATGSTANCFLTRVMVDCDYKFINASVMTTDAVDKIHQRHCKFDRHKLPSHEVTTSRQYEVTGLGSCFDEGVDESRRKTALYTARSTILSSLARQSDQCLKRGVEFQLTDLALTFKHSSVNSTPPTYSVNITVDVKLRFDAQGSFISFSDILACYNTIKLDFPDLMLGQDCNETAPITASPITGVDASVVSRSMCPEGLAGGTTWILGPDDCMCYDTTMEGFETNKGYCPSESYCPVVSESLFACSLRCLREKNCLGYNYDIKGKTCQHHTHLCTRVIQDDNFLFFRKTEGACVALLNTDINCLISYTNLIQSGFLGDGRDKYTVCSESEKKKVEECSARVLAMCDETEVKRFSMAMVFNHVYANSLCTSPDAVPHYPPADSCQLETDFKPKVTSLLNDLLRSFVNEEQLKTKCNEYSTRVRDELWTWADDKNCSIPQKWQIAVQLDLLQDNYMAGCGPAIPDNGDRTNELCSMTDFYDCSRAYVQLQNQVLFGDKQVTLDEFCSDTEAASTCVREQTMNCSETDQIIGQAYSDYFMYDMDVVCAQQSINCSESANFEGLNKFMEAFTEILVRGESADSVWCNKTVWDKMVEDAKAAIGANTSECASTQLTSLTAVVDRVASIRNDAVYNKSWCRTGGKKKMFGSTKCMAGLQRSYVAVRAATRGFQMAWLSGNQAQLTICEYLWGLVDRVVIQMADCDGPVSEFMQQVLDMIMMLIQVNECRQPVDPRCPPQIRLFDKAYKMYRPTVQNQTLPNTDRCAALKDMDKVWLKVDLKSCPAFYRFKREAQYKMLVYPVKPMCSACSNSEAVECVAGFFRRMLDMNTDPEEFCVEAEAAVLKGCAGKLSERCELEPLRRIKVLTDLTQRRYDKYCKSSVPLSKLMKPFCAVEDTKSDGGDLVTDVDVSNVMECEKKCVKSAEKCYAYQFSNGKCTIKKTTWSPDKFVKTNGSFYFYRDNHYKMCKPPARFCLIDKKECGGTDMKTLNVTSLSDCQNTCRYEEKCRAINFYPRTKKCVLKTVVCSEDSLQDVDESQFHYKLNNHEYCAGDGDVKLCRYSGKLCAGSDVGTFTSGLTVQQCVDKCVTTDGCSAISMETRKSASGDDETRCRLKSTKCSLDTLTDDDKYDYLFPIKQEDMCRPPAYVDWKCDVAAADECTRKSAMYMFSYMGAPDEVYRRLMCNSYQDTVECVKTNVKNCDDGERNRQMTNLKWIHMAMAAECTDWPKQPDKCMLSTAYQCLNDLTTVLISQDTATADNATAVFELSLVCGLMKKKMKCVDDSLKLCSGDLISTQRTRGAAKLLHDYLKKYCDTLETQDCSTTSSFTCIKKFWIEVMKVEFSKDPLKEPFCGAMKAAKIDACLVESSVNCPDGFTYMSAAVGQIKEALVRACTTPVCRQVRVAEIVFIVDESGSVKSHNFDKQVKFLRSTVSQLDISHNEVRVAIIEFSSKTNEKMDLKDGDSLPDLLDYIDNMKYKKGSTRTDKPIKDARKILEKKARDGVPKIVILLTDGKSNDKAKTIREMDKLKSKTGASVFVVGVGDGLDADELEQLASGPEFLVKPADFDELEALGPFILNAVYCTGSGTSNPYTAVDPATCVVTRAEKCITDWTNEFMTSFARGEDAVVAVCRKLINTTSCTVDALDDCSAPTKYRVLRALWETRNSLHTVCSKLVMDVDDWKPYRPACDGFNKFVVVKGCVEKLDQKITKTEVRHYDKLCSSMQETVSCVSDAVRVCPRLEREYWKVKGEFTYYALIKANACTKPDDNRPVTGRQCDVSQASVKITQFETKALKATLTNDFKDVCQFYKDEKAVMSATMTLCTDDQNAANKQKFLRVEAALGDKCQTAPEETEGCSLDKMAVCILNFNTQWVGMKPEVENENSTMIATACRAVTTTMDCITEHTSTCNFMLQPQITSAIKLFRVKFTDILVCPNDVYVPPINPTCKLTMAQSQLSTFKIAVEQNQACGVIDVTEQRIKAFLVGCPPTESSAITAAFNTIRTSLKARCVKFAELETDVTQAELVAGDSKTIKIWFQGNPYDKYCDFADNCEVRVRYGLQNPDDGFRCKVKGVGYRWLPQATFRHREGETTCGLVIDKDAPNKKHDVVVRSRWFIKKMKTQKRLVRFYCQVYEDGTFKREEPCKDVEIKFLRRQSNLKSCTCYGDPHCKSYNKVKFDTYMKNMFTIYKHDTLPFEVQAYFANCNPNWKYSCVVLVSVRSGGLVVNFDRAEKKKASKKYCRKNCDGNKEKTKSQGTVMSVLKNGDAYPGFSVFYKKNKKVYLVQFGSGLLVALQEIRGGFNLYVFPTEEDFDHTKGLCGTLREDGNDLMNADKTMFDISVLRGRHRRPISYSTSWIVPLGEYLYYGEFDKYTLPRSVSKEHCTCSTDRTDDSTCGAHMAANDCIKLNGKFKDLTPDLLAMTTEVTRQEPQRRKKRAVAGDLDVDNTPPPGPTWPSPNNMTEDQAIQFCEAQRDQYSAFSSCMAAPYNVDIQPYVDTCVSDIQLGVDQDQAADMSFSQALQVCMDTISEQPYDPNDPDAADQLGDEIENSTCVSRCSGQGSCVSGICQCNAGWTDVDCSVNTTLAPSVIDVGTNSECDTSTTNCKNIRITADGINTDLTPKCRLQELEITVTGSTAKGDPYVVDAEVVTGNQLSCVTRAVAHHEVAISNDGTTYSPVYLYMVYNPACMTCDGTGTEPVCTQQTDSCLVGGTCYANTATLASDDCLVCDVSYSKSTFMVRKTEACYRKHGMAWGTELLDRTDKIIIGCVVALVVLGIAALVVFKYLIKPTSKEAEKVEQDRRPIHRHQPELRYTYEGPEV